MPNPRKQNPKKAGKSSGRVKPNLRNNQLQFGPLGNSIAQSLPIGIIAFNKDLKIIEANAQAAKLIELGEYIDESLAKGTDKPGTPGPNWTERLKSVVSAGKTCEFDNISYTFNDKKNVLQIVCTPLKKDKTARILGGAIIIEDVTEKVDTQRQLANAERLATIGKLASKVAHELNNPMDGILRYINLALRIIEQEKLEKPKEYLTQCRQGLMRMVQIVSELLEFSRSSFASFEYVRIEHIIEDAIKVMYTRVETSNIRIHRNYSRDISQIRNDNLFQVFCNLIKNAQDAMPDGGELYITTRLAADNTAVVEFRDTGTGLPTENTDVIFEPFFTTKDRGTGLGLAICKDIIERYHGRICAENSPKGGSIFTVYLPLASIP